MLWQEIMWLKEKYMKEESGVSKVDKQWMYTCNVYILLVDNDRSM